jgi:hypothetical protein
MEAWQGGPGSVSAYRGIVYILMPGVECPNGQVPQFSFVLSNGATVVVGSDVLCSAARGFHGLFFNGAVWHSNYLRSPSLEYSSLEVFYGADGVMSLTRAIPLPYCINNFRSSFTPDPVPRVSDRRNQATPESA